MKLTDYAQYLPENLREAFLKDVSSVGDDVVIEAANRLNRMLEADPVTVNHFLVTLIQCGPQLGATDAVIMQLGTDRYAAGLLSIINGLFDSKLQIRPVFGKTGIGQLPCVAVHVHKPNEG